MADGILPSCAHCGKRCRSAGAKFCSVTCKNSASGLVFRKIAASGFGVDQWLRKHYYADGCNLATAAGLLGIEKRTLWAFLRRRGLQTKPQSECQVGILNGFHGRRHSDETKQRVGQSSRSRQSAAVRNETGQYGDGPALRGARSPSFKSGIGAYRRLAIAAYGNVCIKCGKQASGRQIDVHHRDGNRLNNALDNLVVLCRGCHLREHRTPCQKSV